MKLSFDEFKRVIFHKELDIVELDFSALSFSSSEDVDYAHDLIETAVNKESRKYYFMVNYENLQIEPDAWFQFSVRGKKISLASSLGSVRFDPNEPARDEIAERRKNEGFDPNLVSTREEAFERIKEIKRSEMI